jgi:hypothetical protein
MQVMYDPWLRLENSLLIHSPQKSRGTLDAVAEAILIVLLLNYIHHIALIRNEERRNTFFVKFHVPGDWNNLRERDYKSVDSKEDDRLILFECDQSRECWSAAGLSLVMQQRFQTCNSVQEDYSI